MTNKTVLSDVHINEIAAPWMEPDGLANMADVRAIVRAALQSPEIQQLRADRDALRNELKSLMQGYLNAIENGRDRIIYLGGDCDSLDVMEAADTNLRSARELLATTETKP